VSEENGTKVIIKASGGYDAPWITFDGADPADVSTQLDMAESIGLFEKVAEAAGKFAATYSLGARTVSVSTQPPAQAPANVVQMPQQQQAPHADRPLPKGGAAGITCLHGARNLQRSKPGARKWAGYFCPLGKGDPNACEMTDDNWVDTKLLG
jgi:hypothetical protein